jgi:hypothetical protein
MKSELLRLDARRLHRRPSRLLANGTLVSDSNPHNITPMLRGDYSLSTSSAAYSLLQWQSLPASWGPPGFSLPSLASPPPQSVTIQNP